MSTKIEQSQQDSIERASRAIDKPRSRVDTAIGTLRTANSTVGTLRSTYGSVTTLQAAYVGVGAFIAANEIGVITGVALIIIGALALTFALYKGACALYQWNQNRKVEQQKQPNQVDRQPEKDQDVLLKTARQTGLLVL